MSNVVIQVDCLCKKYRLGTIGGKRLVDDVNRWWAKVRKKTDPMLKIGQEHRAGATDEEFNALTDVSFEVKQGEILGVIGRNGAGKSTLLKILSRVTAPTSGEVRIKGRIASLLEVGTGFHLELTGRENVFLNGAVLGMTKAEIRGKFDEVVQFAEVEQFIDTPVKRYSSGMLVRLAFAVAAHLEPEILIVDEVLAVGDAAFQKKSLGKMQDVAGNGRTVIFVSHNMAAIQTMCSRGLLLTHGNIASQDSTLEVIAAYLANNALNNNTIFQDPTGFIQEIQLLDSEGNNRTTYAIGETMVIEVLLSGELYPLAVSIGIGLNDALGTRVTSLLTRLHGTTVQTVDSGTRAQCRVEDLPLAPGTYGLKVVIGNNYENISTMILPSAFEVLQSDYYGTGQLPTNTQGILIAKHSWTVLERKGL